MMKQMDYSSLVVLDQWDQKDRSNLSYFFFLPAHTWPYRMLHAYVWLYCSTFWFCVCSQPCWKKSCKQCWRVDLKLSIQSGPNLSCTVSQHSVRTPWTWSSRTGIAGGWSRWWTLIGSSISPRMAENASNRRTLEWLELCSQRCIVGDSVGKTLSWLEVCTAW